MRLRLDWSSGAIPIGAVGLSNVRLPVGTKVTASFRRVGDPADQYSNAPTGLNVTQRIFQGVRGERSCFLLFDPGLFFVGAEIQIWNDVNGAAAIPAGAPWWLGDVIVRQMAEIDIEEEWTSEPVDTGGVITRQLSFSLPADVQKRYFGDPAAPTAVDYDALFSKLDRRQVGLYIPRHRDDAGAFSAYMLHRTAMLGTITKLPKATHKAGSWFGSAAITVTEAPIPV